MLVIFLAVLGVKLKALHMLDKCSPLSHPFTPYSTFYVGSGSL